MSEALVKKAKPYTNPYVAGTLLGIVLFLAFLLTGSGLGASGPINRMLIYIEDIIAPQHINTTPYLIPYAGGSTNPLDNAFVFLTVGILIGGFASGYLHHRLSFTTSKGPRISNRTRWGMAFLGGAVMGYGARFARGCTSGQGLSGGAVLSVGSWAFLLAVFVGAYAVAYTLRKLWI
ncbi:MAG: YeeE/YedE family protein [Candidatus Marinimicrobia bacterium]|nr:YeeE/YedE family protein [Candidatus Neomarinimicrobiota bacterium]